MIRSVAIAVVLAFLMPIRAESTVTGNTLKDYCSHFPEPTEASAMCTGYISGALDAHRGIDSIGRTRIACEPRGSTGDQIVGVILKYLSEHPSQLHLAADSLVWHAFVTAFPCHH